MQEIVINPTSRDFVLSHNAMMRYAELKGIKLYPYVVDVQTFHDFVEFDPNNKNWSPNEIFYYKTREQRRPRPNYQCEFLTDDTFFSPGRDIQRNDPALIQVVRELIITKKDNDSSPLTVINVPDDVEWEIEIYTYYDVYLNTIERECVGEKHRKWL